MSNNFNYSNEFSFKSRMHLTNGIVVRKKFCTAMTFSQPISTLWNA